MKLTVNSQPAYKDMGYIIDTLLINKYLRLENKTNAYMGLYN